MKKLIYILCVWLISQAGVAGGFHYDVYVSTTFESHDNHQLESLHMSWLHDKTVSKLLLQGSDLSTPEIRQLTLQSIAKAMINDLHKLDYLTRLESRSSIIHFDKVTDYQLSLTEEKALKLDFRLPLKTPYVMENQRLKLSHADDNGTAILIYKDPDNIRFDSFETSCEAIIEEQEEVEHGEPAQFINVMCE